MWELLPDADSHWGSDFLVLHEHEDSIRGFSFAPDEKSLASYSWDRTVRIWSINGEQLYVLGHDDYIHAIGYCLEGEFLASVDMRGKVRFWDITTGETRWSFELGGCFSAAISCEGRIAWIDRHGTLWLCDHKGGQKRMLPNPDETGSACKSDASENSASHGDHDAADGNNAAKVVVNKSADVSADQGNDRSANEATNDSDTNYYRLSWVASMAFSPDGQLAVRGDAGQLILWNATTVIEVHNIFIKLPRYSEPLPLMKFSSSGRELATYDFWPQSVCIWSWTGAVVSCRWDKLCVDVQDIALSSDGRLAVGKSDGGVQVWDTNADVLLQEWHGHTNYWCPVQYSPAGQLVSGASDGSIRFWAKTSMNRPPEAKGQLGLRESEVMSYAVSLCEQIVATGHLNGEVRTWDTQTGKALKFFSGHNKLVHEVAISPDCNIVASGSSDDTVRLWSTQTAEELQCFRRHTGGVQVVNYSPDGIIIASAGSASGHESTILLWNVQTGEVLHELPVELERIVRSLAFSPDGVFVVSGLTKGKALLWNAHTGALLRQLHSGESSPFSEVTMSCKKVIAIGVQGRWPVQLWDGESGELLLKLWADDNSPGPSCLEFSTDGETLRTHAGSFNLKNAFPLTGQSPVIQLAPLRLNKQGDRIQQDGVDMLWLPPQYRPCHSSVLAFGKTIAIPTHSRGMAFFRLK
jgi:WD40 repeat protein